jgi:hypothetical protein
MKAPSCAIEGEVRATTLELLSTLTPLTPRRSRRLESQGLFPGIGDAGHRKANSLNDGCEPDSAIGEAPSPQSAR